MQQRIRRIASPVLVAATVGGIIWVSAGDLNPPAGPVTPTMKTLAEVEPRIAINATNTPGDASSIFKITQPGSYYLTANITGVSGKGGIVITSGQVTLDLNGFRLEGAGGSTAIALDCVPDVVIKNGFISNWTTEGILGEDSTGLRIENVHIRNIPAGDTVLVGPGTVVLDSSIRDSATGFQVGDRSRVERCVVRDCTLAAIVVSTGSLVADCTLNDNGDDGIIVGGTRSVVRDNVVNGSGGNGIVVGGAGSVVRDNVVNGSGNIGIRVVGTTARSNRIEGNHVTDGNVGIRITNAGNYVVGNTVKGNADNYDFVAGNQLNILLCEIPESIDWPANVTLAGSLTGVSAQNGITINSDAVTIDLNGFALIGVVGSLDGVAVPEAITNLTVRNGTIRDWGKRGVKGFVATNSQFERLRASGNTSDGLRVGAGNLVTHCTASGNGASGISTSQGCTVMGCTARDNTFDGIFVNVGSTVQNCTAYSNDGGGIVVLGGSTVVGCTAAVNGGDGIKAGASSTVLNCTAFNNLDHGFVLASGSTIAACTASQNTGDGILATNGCRIIGNTCYANGSGFEEDAAGIHITGAFGGSRIEGNNVTANDRGIDVDDAGNIIIKNTASGNTTNYDIVAGNTVGDILDFTAGPGGTITSGNPWANFEH